MLHAAMALGGGLADVGRALGAYAERVAEPGALRTALRRAIRAVEEGQPAVIEAMVSITPAVRY